MAEREIIGGPDAVVTSRDCDMFRWRVRHPGGEQSVYVEIAWALVPESLEEPLRGAVESKGEGPLRELLEQDRVPVRIKLNATGILLVNAEGVEEPM